jgi:hypothetical protein
MSADASAYAVLGLPPEADAAAVDKAYRKLIKRYHPDRAGGDAERAAEINRAYRELRGPRSNARDLILYDFDPFSRRRTADPWIRAALVIAAVLLLLVLAAGPVTALFDRPSAKPQPQSVQQEESPQRTEPMDQPLRATEIDAAVREAVHIARTRDEFALAARSRDCHHDLRVRPTLEQLDRCAAFDDAVVQLQDRDPLRDQGPFSELAVTGRQMSAATMLSNDSLAIDGRLDRIRLKVELALAPAMPAPEPEPEPVEANSD